MPNNAISMHQVWKNYGPIQALRGVNLQVPRGTIYGFLGPNGAGKTTAIRCLLDLIRPNRGSIRVLGIDPQQDPVAVRRRCGYLPGELELDESSTALAMLRHLNDLRGRPVTEARIRELADRLELNLSAPIKNLSKGNKQKIGVVQAFMHQPDLLLLDEPTSGLDPLMQQEVHNMVREASAAGATVFFSSHILQEVQSVAESTAIIRQGEIVEQVKTGSLLSRAMRRVRLTFKRKVDVDPLTRLEGVSLLSADDANVVLLRVEGDMEPLIHALADYPVSEVETERPSLEEVFMAYYRKPQGEEIG